MRAFLIRLTRRSVSEFFDDRCAQQAAAITYHVLFSLFPLAIVVAGASSLSLHATGSRVNVVDTIVGELPLSRAGAQHIRSLLLSATSNSAGLGLVGILGLLYSATGMMASLRTALNRAWDIDRPRPFLRGTLIDVGLVALGATAGLVSLGVTVASHLLGAGSGIGGWLGSLLVPGTFGAVIAFMFFVYLAAQLVLLGAEVASEAPRVLVELARERCEADGSCPRRRRRSARALVQQGLVRLWRRTRAGHNWPSAGPHRH